MRNMRYLICFLLVLIALFSSLSCSSEEKLNNNYQSQHYGISVNLPDGWAAVEGPVMLSMKSIDGLFAFNSWGESGFWAGADVSYDADGNPQSYHYSPGIVARKILSAGAYVALVESNGQPPPEGQTPDEYTDDDLSGLYTEHDWRTDTQDAAYMKNFYKSGVSLTLVVACNKDASDATVAQLNALLKSWRFVGFKVD